jgi:hypothetical protein
MVEGPVNGPLYDFSPEMQQQVALFQKPARVFAFVNAISEPLQIS